VTHLHRGMKLRASRNRGCAVSMVALAILADKVSDTAPTIYSFLAYFRSVCRK
jgi:hypothetical protein